MSRIVDELRAEAYAEGFAEGLAEARGKLMQKEIKIFIEALQSIGATKEWIVSELAKRYTETSEEAESLVDTYWVE